MHIFNFFRGKHRPETIREHVELALNYHYTVLMFNYRWTNVFHCKWGVDMTKAVCNIATQERFLMANGITISPDRKTVYVNDILTSQPKYQYVYNYTDHLGNIRMSYTQNGDSAKKLE